MSKDSTNIQSRFKISEIEFTIRRMELELDYHREQGKILEETIQEKQRLLDRFQPKLRHQV